VITEAGADDKVSLVFVAAFARNVGDREHLASGGPPASGSRQYPPTRPFSLSHPEASRVILPPISRLRRRT